jgi:hypothetical protein
VHLDTVKTVFFLDELTSSNWQWDILLAVDFFDFFEVIFCSNGLLFSKTGSRARPLSCHLRHVEVWHAGRGNGGKEAGVNRAQNQRRIFWSAIKCTCLW